MVLDRLVLDPLVLGRLSLDRVVLLDKYREHQQTPCLRPRVDHVSGGGGGGGGGGNLDT